MENATKNEPLKNGVTFRWQNQEWTILDSGHIKGRGCLLCMNPRGQIMPFAPDLISHALSKPMLAKGLVHDIKTLCDTAEAKELCDRLLLLLGSWSDPDDPWG